jgi:hypothetical protein
MAVPPLPGTVIFMSTSAEQLLEALAPYRQYSELITGIATAAGYSSIEDLSQQVRISWIEPGDQVFTAWVVVGNGFVLHERSTTGEVFSLAVPFTRVRRVAEEGGADGSVRFTIEIDADRNVVELNGVSADDGTVRLIGSSLHAGYSLQGSGERAVLLREFARVLRRIVLGLDK